MLWGEAFLAGFGCCGGDSAGGDALTDGGDWVAGKGDVAGGNSARGGEPVAVSPAGHD